MSTPSGRHTGIESEKSFVSELFLISRKGSGPEANGGGACRHLTHSTLSEALNRVYTRLREKLFFPFPQPLPITTFTNHASALPRSREFPVVDRYFSICTFGLR